MIKTIFNVIFFVTLLEITGIPLPYLQTWI